MTRRISADITRRNRRILWLLSAVVVGMGGLAFASPPLYDLFCRVTGFGGTARIAAAAPGAVSTRTVSVRFDTQVNDKLAWQFEPRRRQVRVALGEEGRMVFEAVNLGDRPQIGRAVFNVTPLKAGKYFNKIRCFCFDTQPLAPGERAEMPVSFYVDPALAEDPNVREVTTVTVSYTMFEARQEQAEATCSPGQKAA